MTRLRDRCTERLGVGRRRRVFVHPDDPKLVVKIAKTNLEKCWLGPASKGRPKRREADFSNPGEWKVWNLVKGTELERWFVPCVSVSDDGLELVQQRAEPVKSIPEGFPKGFYVDAGHHGFGMWNGSVRLVDYAQPGIIKTVTSLCRAANAANGTSLIPKTLGELLGNGTKRTVYAHPERDDLVVKELKPSKKRNRKYVSQRANHREKRIFDALNGREEQKLLAIVHEVSKDGVYLVQERLVMSDVLPEFIPDWMTETRLRHWGWSRDGRLKQCDFESSKQCERFTKKFGIKIR